MPNEQPWEESPTSDRPRFFAFSAVDADGVQVRFIENLEKPRLSRHAWAEALVDMGGERRLFAPSSPQLRNLFASHHPVIGKTFELRCTGEGFNRRWGIRRVG